MTGQRWFLRTPAQYAAAPVGTEVWVGKGRESYLTYWHSGWPQQLTPLNEPREVKRWGTDADHERACEAIRKRQARQSFGDTIRRLTGRIQ